MHRLHRASLHVDTCRTDLCPKLSKLVISATYRSSISNAKSMETKMHAACSCLTHVASSALSRLFTMDMNWYFSAEYYIDQGEWPARLRPTLREDGFDLEVEKPLSTGGALIIPSDWQHHPPKGINGNMVFRTRRVSEEANKALQNAVEVELPSHYAKPSEDLKPSPSSNLVLVYNPSVGLNPYPKKVSKEIDLQNFVNILRGALPNGFTLYKHVPRNRLYLYVGDEIVQWDGDVDVGLRDVTKMLSDHVEENVFLCWNSDLRRYLMVAVHPKKSVLDWEADFDKPAITRALNQAKRGRILAYNGAICSTLTMNVESAKSAVQMPVIVET